MSSRSPSILLGTILCSALLWTLPAGAQRGASVVPRDFVELVHQAETILIGHVLRVQVEPHPEWPQLITIVVSLRVHEVLKGDAGQVFTFRQFIWDIRDRNDALGYRKGQSYLLLMNPETGLGLSSPAGLEQGRFRILPDTRDQAVAVNGHGNAGLFSQISPQIKQGRLVLDPSLAQTVQQHRGGPIALDELKQLVRQFAGEI